MIIECDSCRTKFRLDDSRITPEGVRVRCTKCQNVFIVKPPPAPDEVSVEDVFGISAEGGMPAPAGDRPSEGDESEEGEGEEEDAGGAEEGGEAEEGVESPATTPPAGFEGLDFSFTMDRPRPSDEEPRQAPDATAQAPDQPDAGEPSEAAGEEAGSGGFEVPDDNATDLTPPPDFGQADEGEEGAGGDEWAIGEASGDEERPSRDFDLGIGEETATPADSGEAGEPATDEAASGDEEAAPAGDWDISARDAAEVTGPPEEGGDEGVFGGWADAEGTEGPGDEASGQRAQWDEEEGVDTGGLSVGDALSGLEDEDRAHVRGSEPLEGPTDAGDEEPLSRAEEQLRELEKKVIPFTTGFARDTEPEDEDEAAEEAGDLDWARTPEPGEPEAPADDFEETAASTVGAAGYATAAPVAPARETGAGASRARFGFVAVLLAVIVIGGAALYLGGAFESRKGGDGSSATALAGASVDVEFMKGYVVDNRNFGNLFAIEAMVRNRADVPQEIKGARGVVLSSSGARLAERMTTPGRVLSAEDLKTMTAEELERYFKNPTGGTIPAKGVIPVMVVFTDMPAGIAEYGVDVIR